MRIIISAFFIALLAAVAEYYFAWYSIAIVAFIIMFFFRLKPGKAFLAGFLGIALFWLVAALWEDMRNEHILSKKMAALFHLPNYGLFIVLIVFIGGLVGGLAGWSGSHIRQLFK